jgi:hypothetical protein
VFGFDQCLIGDHLRMTNHFAPFQHRGTGYVFGFQPLQPFFGTLRAQHFLGQIQAVVDIFMT